jgi:hypothetical protein
MIYSFLFVPVKVTIGKKYPETDYGYYPLWMLIHPEPSLQDSPSDIPLKVELNTTAWVLQVAFITLVFLNLLRRTKKQYKR